MTRREYPLLRCSSRVPTAQIPPSLSCADPNRIRYSRESEHAYPFFVFIEKPDYCVTYRWSLYHIRNITVVKFHRNTSIAVGFVPQPIKILQTPFNSYKTQYTFHGLNCRNPLNEQSSDIAFLVGQPGGFNGPPLLVGHRASPIRRDRGLFSVDPAFGQ